jgi:ABC-type polysaccharide/polyol phosphate export permease
MSTPDFSPLFRCKLLKKLVLFSFTVPRRIPGAFFVRNLVERRSLLFQLVRRDFEQRFVGSAIGWIWGIIHPLSLLISWVFVFQVCMRVPLPPGVSNYPLFIFAGMLPWLLFSETVQRSASSLLDNANLITKTVFPSEMIPVSVFLSTLASHLLALVLMIAAAAVWTNQISVFLILLPFYFVVVGLFAVGLGWIVASLHVFLRDTAQMVSVVLIFWFWLTPIFITEKQFPPWARFMLVANPMYYVVRSYRAILLGSAMPDLEDLAIAAAYAVAMFIAGGLFFRHMKRGFADVL